MKTLISLMLGVTGLWIAGCEDPAEDLMDQKIESAPFAEDIDQDDESGEGDQDNESGEGDQDNESFGVEDQDDESGEGDQDNESSVEGGKDGSQAVGQANEYAFDHNGWS